MGHAPATGTADAAVDASATATGTTATVTATVTGSTAAAAAAAGAGVAAAAALKAAVPDSPSGGAAQHAADGYVLEAEELLKLRSAGEGAAPSPSEAVRLLATALQHGGAARPQRNDATTPLALATDLARAMVGAADACMLLWARGGGVPAVLRGRDRRGAPRFNPEPAQHLGCTSCTVVAAPMHPDRSRCLATWRDQARRGPYDPPARPAARGGAALARRAPLRPCATATAWRRRPAGAACTGRHVTLCTTHHAPCTVHRAPGTM